jgi:thiol-disulfide isomerase/thioredoxin
MPKKKPSPKPSGYSVLIAGILSPIAAAYLGLRAYNSLTASSDDRDQDFAFRLSMVMLAMIAPFLVTLTLALWNRRGRTLSRMEKAGLAIAALSLALVWTPLNSFVNRWQQSRNLSLRNVAAPPFDTLDLSGQQHRLQEHSGKVVLINIWATWCYPCRKDMPLLDRLYRERKDAGLAVFGLSSEDADLQRRFNEEYVRVTYPLLTINGDVPALYRNISRYPAIFLIDRKGQLQPAPGPDEPFEEVEAAVDALLRGKSQ